jgi:hypothetical protein
MKLKSKFVISPETLHGTDNSSMKAHLGMTEMYLMNGMWLRATK